MKKTEKQQDPKIDLKHDTLEFADTNEEAEGNKNITSADIYKAEDEEDISAEELDVLGTDDTDNQAYALNTVETDLQQDDDILPDEDWTEDIPDNEEENPEDEWERSNKG
ncbi:hypothetical protein [Ferruginibacter albus]|uniref:hypothetical protein n=1 Tax=Ferruginibacter albus TaxID=2875540 RepID=UPI001CC74187|nr:hypothetical protein [Ferruginibacter albus]UAY50818.1 hypothetical protein K9M53_09465 [Ferruginibacter albus]